MNQKSINDALLPSAYKNTLQPWVQGHLYSVNTFIILSNNIYKCIVEHIASDNFFEDCSKNYWINTSGDIGDIKIIVTNSPTLGWLLCNGQAVLRSEYFDLFNIIGTTYGIGNGTTTFNLPSLNGRVPVGYDATQLEFNVLGFKGGASEHKLTIAELPKHNHWFSATNNNWGNSNDSGYGLKPSGSGYYTNGTGGNLFHNNLQPYIIMNYAIKY